MTTKQQLIAEIIGLLQSSGWDVFEEVIRNGLNKMNIYEVRALKVPIWGLENKKAREDK